MATLSGASYITIALVMFLILMPLHWLAIRLVEFIVTNSSVTAANILTYMEYVATHTYVHSV